MSSSTNFGDLFGVIKQLAYDFQYEDMALLIQEQVPVDITKISDSTSACYRFVVVTTQNEPFNRTDLSSSGSGRMRKLGDNIIEEDDDVADFSLKEKSILDLIEETELPATIHLTQAEVPPSTNMAAQLAFTSSNGGIVEFIPHISGLDLEKYQVLILFSNAQQTNWHGGLLVGQKKSGQVPTPPERRALKVIAQQMGLALITALKVQEQLAAYRVIQQLLIQQDTLVEKERLALSHEIHDTIKQTAFSIGDYLDGWSAANNNTVVGKGRGEAVVQSPEFKQLLVVLQQRSTVLMEQTQNLLKSLRSSVLIERGGEAALIAGIQEIVLEGMTTKPQVKFSFRHNLHEIEPYILLDVLLTTDLNIHISRIAKQSVENALRHSHCTEITILLDVTKVEARPLLRIQITDNGRGFDTSNLSFHQLVQNHHFGLQGMRERALQSKGSFGIISNPGQGGTNIQATFPLEPIKTKPAQKLEPVQI